MKTNNAIILYLEQTLWRIIDLYVRGGHLGGHLDFEKATRVASGHPG